MDNDALIAALGVDAVAAVRGYRTAVVTDAARRGLVLTSSALTDPTRTATETRVIHPVDIRLTFARGGVRADLSGRLLRWSPATGWSAAVLANAASVRYYAGRDTVPLSLVPTAAQVLDWAIRGLATAPARHSSHPPGGVDLDDDPAALLRLIDFIDPPRLAHAHRVLRTPAAHRTPTPFPFRDEDSSHDDLSDFPARRLARADRPGCADRGVVLAGGDRCCAVPRHGRLRGDPTTGGAADHLIDSIRRRAGQWARGSFG
jgi:hypothetical protein